MKRRLMDFMKAMFKPLKHTPIHPQWLSFRDRDLRDWLRAVEPGQLVLDIGCNDRWVEKELSPACQYIGLDYSEESLAYERKVDLLGDAQSLPLNANSFDTVVLFDVAEHIPDLGAALTEINRVLRPGGSLLLQIPFLYPVHDAPFDFRRPTEFGLQRQLELHGFECAHVHYRGEPIETACLLGNIALSQALIRLVRPRYLFSGVLLAPLLLVLVLALNLVGAAAGATGNSRLMPFSYHTIARKVESA